MGEVKGRKKLKNKGQRLQSHLGMCSAKIHTVPICFARLLSFLILFSSLLASACPLPPSSFLLLNPTPSPNVFWGALYKVSCSCFAARPAATGTDRPAHTESELLVRK